MMHNLGRFTCRVLTGCCFLGATAFATHAQPLTFTTFAGPAGGQGSLDGTGSAARFNNPLGVAIDGVGNVYVADKFNHTIRKISPAGVVTTLAGMAGSAGGANGTGGTARFNNPFGLAIDSVGNVYVGGFADQTVRKITPAGVVTTLAGSSGDRDSVDGTGSVARFNDPLGVATDSGGNVYVADYGNQTIRKISPAGMVTTLAGSSGQPGSADGIGGAARFFSPIGVATDSSGNVYVADYGNDTIRRITPAGMVTTLAGSAGVRGSADGIGSAALFDHPGAVATDRSGNVYVTENAETIRKITPAGVVTRVAGGSFGSADGSVASAQFYAPSGLAVDGNGNVYLSELGNNTLRKISLAGVVTTLAGLAGLPGSADGIGSAARFSGPSGVATDAGGNVYVADNFNHTIRKITPAGVVTTLAGLVGFHGSADGAATIATFNMPTGVATDGIGNVYVADNFNHTIRKVTPAGTVTTVAGSPGLNGSTDGFGSGARFNFPFGVAVDSAGSVYVSDDANNTIRKFPSGGAVTTLAGSASASGNADGTGGAARFSLPEGLATDAAGNVYVADRSNSTIRKVTPAGVVTTMAGVPGVRGSADGAGTAARFSLPEGVATDSGGNVYVADSGFNHTIRKITPAGVVTTLAGLAGASGGTDGTGSAARFVGPVGVAIDGSGNVYVGDYNAGKILVGRPALADTATIDSQTATAGTTRQLDTSLQTATSWQWRVIRQPSGSTAALSSTSIRNPVFIPDVADLYIFQLTASNGVNTSITTVSLTATPVSSRRRAVGH